MLYNWQQDPKVGIIGNDMDRSWADGHISFGLVRRRKTMAQDEAYRKAQRKIGKAQRDNAKGLSLSGMGLTELLESLGTAPGRL